MTDKIYRISFDLLEDDFQTLEALANISSATKLEVIRDGISYYKFITNIIKDGGKLIVADKDGEFHKVTIKDSWIWKVFLSS